MVSPSRRVAMFALRHRPTPHPLPDQIDNPPVTARSLPDKRVRSLSNFEPSARERVLSIEIQRVPLSGPQRLVKRIMDIVVAALALIFFLPVMALTAVAI